MTTMGYNRANDSYHSRGDGLSSPFQANISLPPVGTGTNAVVECPYCRSTDTELFSLFGQQLLTVQYYCNACHTPFERIKDDDVLDDFAARKEGQK
jgi:DNA-directed RNA polymerase subunit RPC12/RpoP